MLRSKAAQEVRPLLVEAASDEVALQLAVEQQQAFPRPVQQLWGAAVAPEQREAQRMQEVVGLAGLPAVQLLAWLRWVAEVEPGAVAPLLLPYAAL